MGQPIQQFRPDMSELTAGAAIGLLLVGGGVFAISQSRSTDWETLLLPLFFGGLFCGCGILITGWAINTMSQKVVIYENSIVVRSFLRSRTIQWDDVDHVTEVNHWVRPPLIKGPLKYLIPKSKNRELILYAKDGRRLHFDPASIEQFDELIVRMQFESESRGVPWDSKEKGAHPF